VTPPRIGPLERLPQAVAEQVVRRIVELLDIDQIVQQVDVNKVVQRIDVNAVVAKIDVDAVIERVDANELMSRVDIDRIVERIDIHQIVDRIDMNEIADRIDVNAIADRIDIDALVAKADLGPIIAQSTSGMLGEFLGFLRREVVSLDDLFDTLTLFRRRTQGKPNGPPAGPAAGAPTSHAVPASREGQYAGGITRLLAMGADVAAAWGLFILLTAGIQQAVRLFSGTSYNVVSHQLVGIIALVVWGFVYFSLQWTLSGRTIGMAILGAHVVTVAGHAIDGRAAMIRTIVLPFSIVLWFVGLIGIVLRADRRALHDLCAGTCVVYHWQARGASLPWLHRDD